MKPALITKADFDKYSKYSDSLKNDLVNIVNRILEEKLTPYYCVKSSVESQSSIVIDKSKGYRNTHIMWAFKPISIPPLKFEFEVEPDGQYCTETVDVPAKLQEKKFRVIFEEIKE